MLHYAAACDRGRKRKNRNAILVHAEYKTVRNYAKDFIRRKQTVAQLMNLKEVVRHTLHVSSNIVTNQNNTIV